MLPPGVATSQMGIALPTLCLNPAIHVHETRFGAATASARTESRFVGAFCQVMLVASFKISTHEARFDAENTCLRTESRFVSAFRQVMPPSYPAISAHEARTGAAAPSACTKSRFVDEVDVQTAAYRGICYIST